MSVKNYLNKDFINISIKQIKILLKMTTAINQSELKNQIAEIATLVKSGTTLPLTVAAVSKIWSGDAFRFHRQAVMNEVTGQRLGVAACGINAVAKKIYELNQVEIVEVVEAPQEVVETPKVAKNTVAKTAKTVEKTEKTETAETAETAGAIAEAIENESPQVAKAPKAIKAFKTTTIGDGLKVAYRADLTEQMVNIKTPQDFEDFFNILPENCGIVSRTAPYFTRNWTLRIISADEKTKLSLNEVTGKFDVFVNGEKDVVMTTDLRAANTHKAIMAIAQIQDVIITNGKKTLPTEGCKYGVKLICSMSSKTRLKTLATDFAVVELA